MLDFTKHTPSPFHDFSRASETADRGARKPALIVGSAPSALKLAQKNLSGLKVVAVNNAWRIPADADYAIYASNFPEAARPPRSARASQITGPEYGPALGRAGGELLSGATMAFVAGYWACENLHTPAIGFYGCDMIYSPAGPTHFYGRGAPDPLRDHLSLRSLEAKSMRLFCWGLKRNILLVNCSRSETSRLVFPRVPLSRLRELKSPGGRWQALVARARELFEMERLPPYDRYRRDVLEGPATAYCREIIDRLDARWLGLIPKMNRIFETFAARPGRGRPELAAIDCPD